MSTTLNGQRHPLTTLRTYTHKCFSRLTGGGAAADLVVADAGSYAAGDIVSATYSGSTGIYTIAFRRLWPQLLSAPVFSFVGDVNGFNGVATAIDVTAGTATFKFANNATAADVATTTTVYVEWTVRTNSRN